MENKFLTLKETAKFLRVSIRSLYRYISLRKICAVKVSGRWYISKKELTDFLHRRMNVATLTANIRQSGKLNYRDIKSAINILDLDNENLKFWTKRINFISRNWHKNNYVYVGGITA